MMKQSTVWRDPQEVLRLPCSRWVRRGPRRSRASGVRAVLFVLGSTCFGDSGKRDQTGKARCFVDVTQAPNSEHPTWWWCSVTKSCTILCDPMDCVTPPLTISRSLSKLMSFESVMASAFSSSVALFCFCLQSFPASGFYFPHDLGVHIRWPKYWSFSFSISPSNEYSGLISFLMDWFDLAVQGTLKSLLQHHSLKPSILWHSAFFMVQFSHLCMTGKAIALTIQTFVCKVMPLLFNTLSNIVIAFLPSSKHLLISWLPSTSTVILEPKKRNSVIASTFYPSTCLRLNYILKMLEILFFHY